MNSKNIYEYLGKRKNQIYKYFYFSFSAWFDPTPSTVHDSFIVVHYLTPPPTQLFVQIISDFAMQHTILTMAHKGRIADKYSLIYAILFWHTYSRGLINYLEYLVFCNRIWRQLGARFKFSPPDIFISRVSLRLKEILAVYFQFILPLCHLNLPTRFIMSA